MSSSTSAMDKIKVTEERQREARKLRELFRGRFDQDTALKLITEFGGLLEAVDFVMTEKEDEVRRFMNENKEYLDSLRADSEKVNTILVNKIENRVRQFACPECHRSWWHRVPLRKEVSKCRRCNNKYDPIPREHEFGVGKFICACGNEFTGFAVMSETESECFKCHSPVLVSSMMPPRRDHKPKTRTPHSCNGFNCYNPSHDHVNNLPRSSIGDTGSYSDLSTDPYMPYTSMLQRGGRGQGRQQANNGDDYDDQDTYQSHAFLTPGRNGNAMEQHADQAHADRPVCIHPKSPKRGIRHFSNRHISTGSTVSTFLTQGSIETQSVSMMSALFTIDE